MTPEITPEYLASQGLSKTFPQRFWAKVEKTDFHWHWIGAKNDRTPHGLIYRGEDAPKGFPRNIKAHVASWILNVGPVPEGKRVLHCCPGKHLGSCVSPMHLYIGTDRNNRLDGTLQGTQAILTPEQVHEIKSRYANGGITQTALAREFGVQQPAIWKILNNLTWVEALSEHAIRTKPISQQ